MSNYPLHRASQPPNHSHLFFSPNLILSALWKLPIKTVLHTSQEFSNNMSHQGLRRHQPSLSFALQLISEITCPYQDLDLSSLRGPEASVIKNVFALISVFITFPPSWRAFSLSSRSDERRAARRHSEHPTECRCSQPTARHAANPALPFPAAAQ